MNTPLGISRPSYRPSRREILLIAELPSEALEETDKAAQLSIQVEEAVINLARAVVVEQGRWVFLGDLSLALLLSMVAGDYMRPRFAEGGEQLRELDYEQQASLTLYFSGEQNQELNVIGPIRSAGYAVLRWAGSPLDIIREVAPDALVCIGGRRDTMYEAVRSFQQIVQPGPVFIIADTGGGARQVADQAGDFRVFDREFEMRLAASRRELNLSEDLSDRLIPSYPVMMQELVDLLIED